MFLDEYKTKPKNKFVFLLNDNGIREQKDPRSCYVAENITKGLCTVYNDLTDRISDKAIYFDKKGDYYIKAKECGYGGKTHKLYLKDFA